MKILTKLSTATSQGSAGLWTVGSSKISNIHSITKDLHIKQGQKNGKIHVYRSSSLKEDKQVADVQVEEYEEADEEHSFTRSVVAEGQKMAVIAQNKYRVSNGGGNQADDEEETMRDSEISLAILGKQLHNI